jgi:hypothetical protein
MCPLVRGFFCGLDSSANGSFREVSSKQRMSALGRDDEFADDGSRHSIAVA